MKAIWSKYVVLLDSYPLATKAITGGIIASLSDFLCQKLECCTFKPVYT